MKLGGGGIDHESQKCYKRPSILPSVAFKKGREVLDVRVSSLCRCSVGADMEAKSAIGGLEYF